LFQEGVLFDASRPVRKPALSIGAVDNEKTKGGGLRPRLAVGLVELPIDQRGDLEKARH
jgi:hypothetical protein